MMQIATVGIEMSGLCGSIYELTLLLSLSLHVCTLPMNALSQTRQVLNFIPTPKDDQFLEMVIHCKLH